LFQLFGYFKSGRQCRSLPHRLAEFDIVNERKVESVKALKTRASNDCKRVNAPAVGRRDI